MVSVKSLFGSSIIVPFWEVILDAKARIWKDLLSVRCPSHPLVTGSVTLKSIAFVHFDLIVSRSCVVRTLHSRRLLKLSISLFHGLFPTKDKISIVAHQCFQIRFPSFLRQRCQSMLAAQWMHRLPFIQARSPAQLAAELVFKALERVPNADNLTVVDFCSGGGGKNLIFLFLFSSTSPCLLSSQCKFILPDSPPRHQCELGKVVFPCLQFLTSFITDNAVSS